MKKIIVLLLIGLLIISCKKENQNTSQTSPEIQKSLPEVEQNSRKNIASIGDNIDVWYEINDSVVFAKKIQMNSLSLFVIIQIMTILKNK